LEGPKKGTFKKEVLDPVGQKTVMDWIAEKTKGGNSGEIMDRA
jgi:hypothetical protein